MHWPSPPLPILVDIHYLSCFMKETVRIVLCIDLHEPNTDWHEPNTDWHEPITQLARTKHSTGTNESVTEKIEDLMQHALIQHALQARAAALIVCYSVITF